MFHYFKIIKDNEKLHNIYSIAESLEDGAVVQSITARNTPKPDHYSYQRTVGLLKTAIQEAYRENNFVKGSGGIGAADYFQKEFDVIMKLSPEKVWDLHSQYKLRYSIILPETTRFSRSFEYIACDKFTITRNKGNVELA